MKKIVFKNDESILFEGIVNSNVKLTLTNQKMIFEKKRGLFKKKYRVVDIIPLEQIKFYKNNGGVRQKMSKVIVKTVNKEITIKCSSIVEAKKIVDGILYAKTGMNVIERSNSKISKAVKIIKGCKNTVVLVGGLILGIKSFIDNNK